MSEIAKVFQKTRDSKEEWTPEGEQAISTANKSPSQYVEPGLICLFRYDGRDVRSPTPVVLGQGKKGATSGPV